jgi:hypothetical protein
MMIIIKRLSNEKMQNSQKLATTLPCCGPVAGSVNEGHDFHRVSGRHCTTEGSNEGRTVIIIAYER